MDKELKFFLNLMLTMMKTNKVLTMPHLLSKEGETIRVNDIVTWIAIGSKTKKCGKVVKILPTCLLVYWTYTLKEKKFKVSGGREDLVVSYDCTIVGDNK